MTYYEISRGIQKLRKKDITCFSTLYFLSSLTVYTTVRQFQRLRNNEVCEARGGDCKRVLDLFSTHLRKPNPIPEDLYRGVKYVNDLNWMIMSSEGTGK